MRLAALVLLCTTGGDALVAPLTVTRTHAPALAVRTAMVSLKAAEPTGLVRGIGEGRDLPSASGINTFPVPLQAATVLGILSVICAGASLIAGPGFDLIRDSFLWNLSRPTWPLLGLIYLAAGAAHFTELEGFSNITPPNGTWGFWWTPFSTKFNVQWTGVAEVFGGLWLLLGALAPVLGIALPAALGPMLSDGALTLWLLTLAVTPANIYALTHGANFPLDLETPPVAHAVRLAFQCVLLALLWEMAGPTVLDFKINMGLL